VIFKKEKKSYRSKGIESDLKVKLNSQTIKIKKEIQIYCCKKGCLDVINGYG